MKIFGFEIFRSGSKRNRPADDDDFWYEKVVGAISASGIRVTPELAESVCAVFACIRVKAETLATLPLPVYKRESDSSRQRDDKHPVAKLLRRPNPFQSLQDFVEMMTWHLELRGNAYAEIFRSAGNKPLLVLPRHPDRTEAKLDAQGELYYEHTNQFGTARIIDPKNMLHLKMLSENGIVGRTVLNVQASTIGSVIAMDTYAAATFKNNAQPGGLLTHPGKFKDEAAQKRVLDSWKKAYSGVKNAGKVAILEEGMKWEKLGLTNQDLQFIEQERFSSQKICAIFRVPPHKIGDLSQSKYANIEIQNIDFVNDSLTPNAKRWEAESLYKLFSESEQEKYFVEFLFNALLRGDSKSRNEALQIQRNNGVISVNEWRKIENMNPIGTEGDIHMVPLNQQDLKLAAQPPEDDAAGEDDSAQSDNLTEKVQPVSTKAYRRLFDEIIYQILTRQANGVEKGAKSKDLGAYMAKFWPEHRQFVAEKLRSASECYLDLAAFAARYSGKNPPDDRFFDMILTEMLDDFSVKLASIDLSGDACKSTIAGKLALDLMGLIDEVCEKGLVPTGVNDNHGEYGG